MKERIIELEKLIRIHSSIYYEGLSNYCGIQPISDDEFDNLVNELTELDPDNKLISSTGFEHFFVSDKEKVVHEYGPIEGINKKPKNPAFYKNYAHESYCLSPKLDGSSVIIYYNNGKLIAALSRGNGTTGTNIIDVISQLSSIPKTIRYYDKLVLRGELINISAEGNIRNQSNGFIMRKGYKITEEDNDSFKFVPYNILNKSLTRDEETELIHKLGFIQIPRATMTYDELDGLWLEDSGYLNIIDELSTLVIDDVAYQLPIDGIIFEKNDQSFKKEGTNIFTRPMIAFKLDSTSEKTTVIGHKWKVSPYGKVFPTVLLDKVDLEGANVKKSSGGSYQYLLDKGLGIGAEVIVVRSGGVIPYIKEIVKKSDVFNIPEGTYKDGAHLYMKDFSVQESRLVRNIFNRHVPDGYGADLYSRLVEDYPSQMSNLKDYRKFIEEIHESGIIKSKNITTGKQLAALSILSDNTLTYQITTSKILSLSTINGLGPKYRKKINAKYPSIDSFITDIENSVSIKKLSNKLVEKSVKDNLSNIKLVAEFYKSNPSASIDVVDEIEDNSGKIKVILTNFTGSPVGKKDFTKTFDELFSTVGNVKDCDILVYHKPGSSKMKVAEKLGKKIISITELMEMSPSEIKELVNK